MTALLIFGIVAFVCVIGLCVFIALKLSEAVLRAFRTLDLMQRAYQEHMDKTLDRLMTIRWEDFVSVREIEESDEEGGFFAPGEQEEGGVEVPSFLGTMRPLRDPDEEADHEERLLREDFV